VPDDTPQCASLDALVSSCTTLASFYGLPLSAQGQCLCNVGLWDAVVAACLDQLTVDGQLLCVIIDLAWVAGPLFVLRSRAYGARVRHC